MASHSFIEGYWPCKFTCFKVSIADSYNEFYVQASVLRHEHMLSGRQKMPDLSGMNGRIVGCFINAV